MPIIRPMTLTEDHTTSTLITEYTPEFIRIQEKMYESSILITPTEKILPWPVRHLDELTQQLCEEMIQYRPEIVIIGTGEKHLFPDLDIIRFFDNYHMGIEMMSTSAACRTYNVLLLEGRKIIAGLIL